MKRVSVLFLALISIINLSNAQVPGIGSCPNFKVQQNFDVKKYAGLWYDIRKYPFIFTLGGRCITANYALNADSTVQVINTQIRNGKEDSVVGSAKIVTPNVGSLTVTFPGAPVTSEGNYNILYTDYNDLSVVFSCSSFLGFLNLKSMWILTRTRFPTAQTIEKAYNVLRDNGISTMFISETDQRNCPENVQFNSVY